MNKKIKYKTIDLFSGCGGMSWGLHKLGFDIIAGIDNWKISLDTFKLNHPEAQTYNEDIGNINVRKLMSDLKIKTGELDCLVGGPPCQGFSKNVPAASRLLNDPRNQLFREFLRFVKILKPKVVVMENVAEIYNAFSGVIRNEIIENLEKLGYNTDVKVLYAPDYGVPQRRRRCFFFASRTKIKAKLPKPTFGNENCDNKYVSAWDAISDLPTLEHGEGKEKIKYNKNPKNNYQDKMRNTSSFITDHVAKKLKDLQYKRLDSIKPGQAINDLPEDIRPKAGYSGAYGRLDFESIAPTITRWLFHPGSGRYGHPVDTRLITIREAARLQSFSDDFNFLGTYTEKAGQIGNAVPPLLMEAVGIEIINCLGG
jgi:DNA (cytosine-5)-methyltransferase 1